MGKRTQEKAPLWLILAFAAVGAFMILLAADIIAFPEHAAMRTRKRGILEGYHHWQLTAIGIAFAFIPLSALFGRTYRYASALCGMAGVAAFGAVMLWFICFSERIEPVFQVVMGIVVLAGCGGAMAGLFNRARGKETDEIDTSDPVDVACVYAAWGRKAQARQILEQALVDHPQRAAAINEAIRQYDLRE